jgi:hypothetical protein
MLWQLQRIFVSPEISTSLAFSVQMETGDKDLLGPRRGRELE